MFSGAVNGDGECLVARPAASDGFDGVVVFDVGEGQIQRLADEAFLLADLLRPELSVLLSLVRL